MQNMSGGKTALGLDSNIGALLCYINICLPIGLIYSIIVVVSDKENKLPRFHAFQSLLLTGVAFVVSIVIQIISRVMLAADAGILGMLVGLISLVFGLGLLILVIIAAIKAFQGQIFKIPVIGNIADNMSN